MWQLPSVLRSVLFSLFTSSLRDPIRARGLPSTLSMILSTIPTSPAQIPSCVPGYIPKLQLNQPPCPKFLFLYCLSHWIVPNLASCPCKKSGSHLESTCYITINWLITKTCASISQRPLHPHYNYWGHMISHLYYCNSLQLSPCLQFNHHPQTYYPQLFSQWNV